MVISLLTLLLTLSYLTVGSEALYCAEERSRICFIHHCETFWWRNGSGLATSLGGDGRSLKEQYWHKQLWYVEFLSCGYSKIWSLLSLILDFFPPNRSKVAFGKRRWPSPRISQFSAGFWNYSSFYGYQTSFFGNSTIWNITSNIMWQWQHRCWHQRL